MVDGAALSAGSRLLRFLARLIGIENVIALRSTGGAATGSAGLGRLSDRLHLIS